MSEILTSLFPQRTAIFAGRGGREVNGLPKDTKPANCTVLASGLAKSSRLGRQEHFLVTVDSPLSSEGKAMVYMRICTAYEGSGYDEFAVIYDIVDTAADKERVQERALGFIKTNCQ
jgi:hypothetical protein